MAPHSAHVTQIIADRAPLFEKSSIDEFYLDLTGMDRFFGIEKWAWELRETIMRETRLPISAGLSINKTVAKMATNAAKPNGRLHVPEQEVLAFLAPQPVEHMNMIGEAATRTLNQMGIATLGQLAATPRQTLITALGKHGDMLWRRANVQDRPPIVPYREAKSISNEHTFSEDIADLKLLHASLLGMVEKVGYKLRLKKRMASILTVKIRYADFPHRKHGSCTFPSRPARMCSTPSLSICSPSCIRGPCASVWSEFALVVWCMPTPKCNSLTKAKSKITCSLPSTTFGGALAWVQWDALVGFLPPKSLQPKCCLPHAPMNKNRGGTCLQGQMGHLLIFAFQKPLPYFASTCPLTPDGPTLPK